MAAAIGLVVAVVVYIALAQILFPSLLNGLTRI